MSTGVWLDVKVICCLAVDIVKVGDRRPFYQLDIVREEHLIVAITGTSPLISTHSQTEGG